MVNSGCEDFLDQKDTSGINENSLFLKAEDGYSLVTGVYSTFHFSVDYMLKGIWFTANFPTQDFHNDGSDTFWNTYEVPTDFDALNTFWVGNYIGISRANAAIPILQRMKDNGVLSEKEANTLLGECYFLRGAFYYYLAVDFGGVPLELETVKDEGLHPRNSQDEVFASVVSDMNIAAGLLPWKTEQASADRGRATKEAALAYQGDALMWLKQYKEAVEVFNQLDSKCQLEENFLNIHEIANRNGKELDIMSLLAFMSNKMFYFVKAIDSCEDKTITNDNAICLTSKELMNEECEWKITTNNVAAYYQKLF